MPLSRRSRCGGRSLGRPANKYGQHVGVEVEVHDLSPRVHPGVRAAGTHGPRALGSRSAVASAASSRPCTVRSPGWMAQPLKWVAS